MDLLASLPLQVAIAVGALTAFVIQWLLVRGSAARYWTLSWLARFGATFAAIYYVRTPVDALVLPAPLVVSVATLFLAGCRVATFAAVQATHPAAARPTMRSPWVWATIGLSLGAALPAWLIGISQPAWIVGLALFRFAHVPVFVGLLIQVLRADAWPDRRTRFVLIAMLAESVVAFGASTADGLVRFPEPRVIQMASGIVLLQIVQAMLEGFAGLYAVFSRSNDELHRLAGERERARHLEELGRLTSGVAHDLNNVLATVLLSSENANHAPTESERQEGLEVARTAVRRGASIVRSLGDAGHVGSSPPVEVDIARVVDDVLPLLKRTLTSQQSLRVQAASLPLLVRLDRTRFERVLMNLVANARDAMREDGIVDVRFEVVASTHGTYAALAVQDNGVGIPPALLGRVAEPFFTTKPPGQGSGLGLAMARAFADEFGGTMELHSTVGRGTTVTLRLPLSGQTGAGQESAS